MKKIISVLSFFGLAAACIFSKQCSESARLALDMCLSTLFPSLFPFFVFSKMFILSGGANFTAKPLSRITKAIFNIGGKGSAAILLGILCGYPIGAKTAAEMYQNGEISKNEAQRLCGFCNNSGPLFLIGAVGEGMLLSKNIGVLLYFVHILSALTVGIVLRGECKTLNTSDNQAKNCENIFVCAVEESITAILNIFGYVTIFACITAFIKNPLLTGFFEITNALKKISALPISLNQKFIVSAMLASWGGLSVHMQTFGILSKCSLSFKKYIFAKVLHSFFAFLYAVAATKFFPPSLPTFALSFNEKSPLISTFLIVCTVIFGIYIFHLNIIILRKNYTKHTERNVKI